MSTSPAAWHPDPLGRHEFRYWDGKVWTQHVANGGQASVDPIDHGSPAQTDLVRASNETDSSTAISAPKHGFVSRLMDDRRAKAESRSEFEALVLAAARGNQHAIESLPAALAQSRHLYKAAQLHKLLWESMGSAVRSVIDDDVLTAEEEAMLHRLGEILGTPVQAMDEQDPMLFEELIIAGINAGRFPRTPEPGVVLKRGEEAYASFAVELLKEVAVREFRGSSGSVSIPLGGGVRYRVGGVRGRSEVIGTQLVQADYGVLVVTSQRSLFLGQKRTLEFRGDRLVGLQQFSDGLRLNVSNRQTASLFRFSRGSAIAAALISASAGGSG